MHLLMRLLCAAAMLMPLSTHANPGTEPTQANGTFDVHVTPADATAFEKSSGLTRYEMTKTWTGDLVATSTGEMLTSITASTGAMAYVAMEQVTGRLGQRTGSFSLAHTATMTKGDAASAEMSILIVKGSGTGDFAGISGKLKIIIDAKGKHTYILEYQLP